MSIFYQFNITNDSSSDIICEDNKFPTQPVVDKADDYKLSVVKFTLPASSIDSFVIENNADYVIQYSYMTNRIFGVPTYELITGQSRPYDSDQFPIRSIQAFIECFNRSSLLAYKNLLSTAGFANSASVNRAGSFSNAGTVLSQDITFDVTPGMVNGMSVGYVSLDMRLYATTSSQNQICEVRLISPSGLSAVCCSGQVLYDNLITFEDASIVNQTSHYNRQLQGSVQPLTGFIQFAANNTNAVGTWIVRVISRNKSSLTAFNITYDMTLNIHFAPFCKFNLTSDVGQPMYVPKVPPTLSISSDNKLQLLYDSDTQRSGFAIRFSPKLYGLLGFDGYLSSLDSFYTIKLPQIGFEESPTLNIITYTQPISTLYRLLDIASVELRTSNLPINGEVDSTSRVAIICSIDVASSDLDNSSYSFYNNQLVDRAYELQSSNPIQSINLQVWIRYRSSNISRQAYLPPNTSFTSLLKFIKI